jgi:IS5 family transposase
MGFLGLGLEDPVPDTTTPWLFRESLVDAGLIDKLFERFSQHLRMKGYRARRPDNRCDACVGAKAAQQPGEE